MPRAHCSKWTKICIPEIALRERRRLRFAPSLGSFHGTLISSQSFRPSVQSTLHCRKRENQTKTPLAENLNVQMFGGCRRPSWIRSSSSRRFMIWVTLARDNPSRAAILALERLGSSASSFCQISANSNGCDTRFSSLQQSASRWDVCGMFGGNGTGAVTNGSVPQR